MFSQVPVACKSCPCGYIFISRKLLHAKRAERSPPITGNTHRGGKKGITVLPLYLLEAKDVEYFTSLCKLTVVSSLCVEFVHSRLLMCEFFLNFEGGEAVLFSLTSFALVMLAFILCIF